jgi:CheY-like chemotaxis protein
MPKTILIVDDNSGVRSLLGDLVRDAGFAVCGETGDGGQAIEMTLRLGPDLVILDFSMPRMNGAEVASVLKRYRPDLPIIILTLFAERIGPVIQKAVGVDVVVSKADGMAGVLKAMHRLVGASTARNIDVN